MVVGEPSASDLPVLVSKIPPPWLLSEADIPWLYYICKKKYPSRYEPEGTEQWFVNIVLKQPLMFLPQRTANAFCISMLSVAPWSPSEFECNIVFICCDDGAMYEGIKLLRSSIEWAKRRKCAIWRISSDTDSDMEMLARRLGATELSPRFMLRL